MKKYLFGATAVLAMGLVSTGVFAQQEQDKIKIRIEKNVNGQVQVIEKEIDATGMTEKEREQAIESMQDSLFNSGEMKGKKVKIVIDDNRIERLGDEEEETVIIDGDEDFEFDEDHGPGYHVYRKKHKGGDNDWDEFRWEMDRFGNEMRKLGEEMPRHIQRTFPRVYAWTDEVLSEVGTASIRSLDVFPNKPESEVINVRFYAPQEGDVTITVLDTKGKQVAQKEAKNFQGEYVGQLELKKAEKGTYFVIVSQGEDGISRRVVID